MRTTRTPKLANSSSVPSSPCSVLCLLFGLSSVLAVGACAKSQPLSGPTTPTVAPAPAGNAQTPAVDPAPAAASNAFSMDGYPGVPFGVVISEATVAAAFAPMEVRAETLTSEGEEVGKSLVVNDGKRDIAVLILNDDDGSVDVMRLSRGALGPKNLEPGVTTYEQVRDSLGVHSCTGGAEEFGELIMCGTKTSGISVDFFDKTGNFYATPIEDKDIEKVLANTVVEHVNVAR